MIYRKTRLGFPIEKGSKNQLMQNKDDGYEHAEILVEGYNAFEFRDKSANPGLSAAELETLTKLDVILDEIDIVVTPNADKIRGVCKNGHTFTINRGHSNGDFSNEPLNSECEKAVLKKAYEQFTKDNKLTKKEIELLEKIDEILPDAAISVNPISGDATLVSQTGFSNLPFPKGRGKSK